MPVTRGACPCRLKSDFLSVSEKQRAFGQAKSAALPRACRECKWLFTCHGECPKNRVLKTPDGESGLNWLCAGLKAFFAHTERPMREMADLLKSGRYADEIMIRKPDEPLAMPAMSTQSNPRKT